MKKMALVAVCAAAVLVQLSGLAAMRPLGVVPAVALVVVVLVGLEATATLALVVAVAGGVMLDLASGANMGLWTGVLVLAALAAGLVRRSGIETGSWWVPAVMVAAGTLTVAAVILVGIASAGADWQLGVAAGRVAMEIAVNMVVLTVLRPVVRWLAPPASADTMAMS